MSRQVHPEIDLEKGQRERNYGSSQRYPDNSRDLQTRNDLSRQLSQTFRPTLTAMKLAGEHFGETTLTEPRDLNWGKADYLCRFYSSLVVFSEWLLVFLGLITLIYQGFGAMNVLLTLFVTTAWYTQCASSITICLVVLPLVKSRKSSRFSQFISSFMTTTTDLEGVRRKTTINLAVACFVAVANAAIITLFSVKQGGVISGFKPWNGNIVVRVFEITIAFYNSFAWTLPVQLYCTTCLVLERMFETLKKKVTSSLDAGHPFTISCLRQEYLRLCKVLEMADKVFSPLLFVTVASYTPLTCVNLYLLISYTKKLSKGAEFQVLWFMAYLYWSASFIIMLPVLCFFGSRVNDKAHSFYETLQMSHVSTQDIKDNSELMLFLAHVRGEPIGLSAGALGVINKSFFLTLVGIIASYFAVLLTLP